MSSVAELKLRQRLLKEKMTMVDTKVMRCTNLLNDRRSSKAKEATSSSNSSLMLQTRKSKPEVEAKMSISLGKASPISKDIAALRDKHLLHSLQVATKHEQEVARRPPPGPGKAGAYKRTKVPESLFPIRHARSELPCSIEHVSYGLQLSWVCPLNVLDYEHYLPMFVDGLLCTSHPFNFMARQGCHELLEESRGSPERVIPCLPKIIPLVRVSLATKHPQIVIAGLQFLRELANCDPVVGVALVPYYRQVLGFLNLFVSKRRNLGDQFDYSQNKESMGNIGSFVQDTLEMLERTGGEKAFAQIKYMVPTYQSCF